MSRLARRPLPAAKAVRARNDGANSRLTRANAPFFRNTLREVIALLQSQNLRRESVTIGTSRPSPFLKFGRSKSQRDALLDRCRFGDGRPRGLRHIVRERGVHGRLPAVDGSLRVIYERAAGSCGAATVLRTT